MESFIENTADRQDIVYYILTPKPKLIRTCLSKVDTLCVTGLNLSLGVFAFKDLSKSITQKEHD